MDCPALSVIAVLTTLFQPLVYLTVQVSIIRVSFEPIADFDEAGRWPAERNLYCTC